MKLSIILVLLVTITTSFSTTAWGKRVPPYYVISTQVDTTLESGMSRVSIQSPYLALREEDKLLYGYNGTSYGTKYNDENKADFTLPPGKYVFLFHLSSNQNYQEIETDSIEIKEGMNTTIQLNFFIQAKPINAVRKPVIYLYPETKTEVTLNVDIKGTEKFLYPAYKDAWKFTAHPNGDLAIGELIYNYLFWEAKSDDLFELSEEQSGFIVRRDEVVNFLEEKLTLANLTSKEKADFITFWGPMLAQNELNLVHFIFNDECDRYAEMNINPAPANSYRIYIVWAPLSKAFEIKEQTIQAANRDGFHLIEWGGFETTLQSKLTALHR